LSKTQGTDRIVKSLDKFELFSVTIYNILNSLKSKDGSVVWMRTKYYFDFFFELGFWVGLLMIYFTHGKHMLSTFTYKLESMGKRYYIPPPYNSYGREHYNSKRKRRVNSLLLCVAVALIMLGVLAMLGLFD
jgi:hypothetical protein